MNNLRQQELIHFYESIWDMVYDKETDTLRVYCSGPKIVEYQGEKAQNFYNAFVLYLSKKEDPRDRITPLERYDENGIYCYKTERANIRKTMSVEELARDDRYHDYGQEFLSEIVSCQHSCAKLEAEIMRNCKAAVAKLDNVMRTTDMASKVTESDLKALKAVIEESASVAKSAKKINALTLTILERWLA